MSKRIAGALTVLVTSLTMLSGGSATAFAVPGDDTTSSSPTTTATGSATTTPRDETTQTGLTPVELNLSPGHGEPESTVKGTAMLMVHCAPPQTGVLALSWDDSWLSPTNITAADRATGSIAFDFTVPATAKAGPHTVRAVCPAPDDLQSRTYIAHGYTGSASFTVDPVETPTLTLTPGQGLPGAQVAASGIGFACDTDLVLLWDDGSLLADQLSGTFTEYVRVPADASADSDHSITASCREHPDITVSQPFTVTPAAVMTTVTPGETQSATELSVSALPKVSEHPTPNETPPPPSGGPPWWLIALMVAAVLAGATYFYRRSRARPAHVGANVSAVAHFDTVPTVAVHETPDPGDVACSIGLVPHPDPGTQTFVEVSP